MLAQGKYAEADSLYLRVIDMMEKALGPDHPNIGVCLHNRALLSGEYVWGISAQFFVHCGRTWHPGEFFSPLHIAPKKNQKFIH